MANNGCILGCITVDSSNNGVAFYEDGILYETTIPSGDYFPKSSVAGESLVAAVESAIVSVSAGAFALSFSDTTGLFSIWTPDFPITILTEWTASIFPSLGYIENNTPNDAGGGSWTATAEQCPVGTWFPRTVEGDEEIVSDTYWMPMRKGRSQQGIGGKRFTKTWDASRRRIIRYSDIVGANGFSYPLYDIRRAEDCYRDHWSIGKRMRIFTKTRATATAVDGEEIFEAVLLGGTFEPSYSGGETKDWWDATLEFRKYVA